MVVSAVASTLLVVALIAVALFLRVSKLRARRRRQNGDAGTMTTTSPSSHTPVVMGTPIVGAGQTGEADAAISKQLSGRPRNAPPSPSTRRTAHPGVSSCSIQTHSYV